MKFPRPWYRPARGRWYVTLRGKQHNLGPDKGQAIETYKQLIGKAEPAPDPVTPSVVGLIDKFLEWCREHRAAETYEWYRWRLQMFAESIGRELVVAQLRPFHVDEWLAPHSALRARRHTAARWAFCQPLGQARGRERSSDGASACKPHDACQPMLQAMPLHIGL